MTSIDWDSTAILVILPDDLALRFPPASRRAAEITKKQSLKGFLKSFLPEVKRIEPAPASLPSGRIVRLASHH